MHFYGFRSIEPTCTRFLRLSFPSVVCYYLLDGVYCRRTITVVGAVHVLAVAFALVAIVVVVFAVGRCRPFLKYSTTLLFPFTKCTLFNSRMCQHTSAAHCVFSTFYYLSIWFSWKTRNANTWRGITKMSALYVSHFDDVFSYIFSHTPQYTVGQNHIEWDLSLIQAALFITLAACDRVEWSQRWWTYSENEYFSMCIPLFLSILMMAFSVCFCVWRLSTVALQSVGTWNWMARQSDTRFWWNFSCVILFLSVFSASYSPFSL